MSELFWLLGLCAVAEAGLEIGRAAHPDPEIKGGGGQSQKNFLGPTGLSLVEK